METLQTIRTRQSIGRVKPERPPKTLIEQLLQAAAQAPNHFLTEPWRFYVLAGKAREDLGKAMATALRRQMADPDSDENRTVLDKEFAKPLRAPVVIVVATKKSSNPKAVPIEDVEATSAAVENLLLAAHDLGLAAQWRTGEAAYDPGVKRFFGLDPDDHLAAFVYVGYPDVSPHARERALSGDKVQWRGWE